MGSHCQRRVPNARQCVWRYDSSRTSTATIPCWRPGVRPSTVWNRPKREYAAGAVCGVGLSSHLEIFWFSRYCMLMETTQFELTPEQKGLLESLACETGMSVASLIAKALEKLQ